MATNPPQGQAATAAVRMPRALEAATAAMKMPQAQAVTAAMEMPLTHEDKGLWRGVGERPLRGLYNALASSSPSHQSAIISFVKKPPPDPREYLVQPLAQATYQTKQFFFSRAAPNRVGHFQTIAERAAKRERGHALHASNGEQARRIRHSNSLLAPKARPRTAAAAPFYVNSMNGRLGRQDEERWC